MNCLALSTVFVACLIPEALPTPVITHDSPTHSQGQSSPSAEVSPQFSAAESFYNVLNSSERFDPSASARVRDALKRLHKGKGVMRQDTTTIGVGAKPSKQRFSSTQATDPASSSAVIVRESLPSKNKGKIRKKELPEPIRHHIQEVVRKPDETDERFVHRKNLQISKYNYWTKRKERTLMGVPAEEQHDVWQNLLRKIQTQKNEAKSNRYWARKAADLGKKEEENKGQVPVSSLSSADRQKLYRERNKLRRQLREDPENESLLSQATELGLYLDTYKVKHRSDATVYHKKLKAKEMQALDEGVLSPKTHSDGLHDEVSLLNRLKSRAAKVPGSIGTEASAIRSNIRSLDLDAEPGTSRERSDSPQGSEQYSIPRLPSRSPYALQASSDEDQPPSPPGVSYESLFDDIFGPDHGAL
ncbi:hypothetical protein CBS101457_005285 [Exobasidium rhododendri]|nr:hypothetical protein CBS101457_005285 [Exobasidium rhododendri]